MARNIKFRAIFKKVVDNKNLFDNIKDVADRESNKQAPIGVCKKETNIGEESRNRLPSSRGLGHIPFTDAAGVRIPLGVPFN